MSVDIYPSTYDCPVEEGGDPVLGCLLAARERIRRFRSTMIGVYVNSNGQACAVGAIFAADGLTYEELLGLGNGLRLLASLEFGLSRTAREALQLLDAVAVERRPESADYGHWCGPLEWINEEWLWELRTQKYRRAEKRVRKEILAIYDETIARRRREIEVPPETWPIIEHEPEDEPVVPAELAAV